MREVRLREAKANLSAVVDDAAQGNPALITKHGRPAAVVVGVEDWERLNSVPTFGRLLAASPLEAEDIPPRDATPMRPSDP